MENDLNRSVRMLEDALATPGRGLFKKVVGGPVGAFSSHLDLSASMATSHDLQKLSSSRFLYEDTMGAILKADKSITGAILQAGVPWETTINSLYTEFFEILQGHTGTQDILEVLSELARCCSDALNVVRNLRSKVAVNKIEDELWLERERDSWRLLLILYQDRLMSQGVDEEEMVQYFGKSEKICVDSLFKRESLIRECQLVIDWLESQAADKEDQVLHFSDSTVGWENTLHQLQSVETIAFSSSRQIVDKLDPDAPHYQKKPLHDLDMEDEKQLSRKIFREIRCGKLEEAQKLGRQCGQAWKAALLEGWRLYHNPNIRENYENDKSSDVDDGYEEMDSNELKDIEGNQSRDVWKIMALTYCKQDWINPYEKASVAAFCGYIDAMLPVCREWQDALWAYMKSMVDIRVESEVRDCCTRDNPYLPLPDDYWTQRMSLNDVFLNLESSQYALIREQSKCKEYIIQKYVILDEIPELLIKLENWATDTHTPTQFLRFSAHFVLFLEQIGLGNRREQIDNILEAYIKRLMEMKDTHMVAYYTSKLSGSVQVSLYARHLENILDYDERRNSLEFAEECGLDVFSITKQVVENIRNKPQEVDNAGNLQKRLSEIDKLKISSLDWVIFYENQRVEAMVQSNALIFSFLLLGKIDAAQLVFNKIPSDSVEKVLHEVDEKDEQMNRIVKEHLSYKSYLDAYEAFNEWFRQIKSKPTEPEKLPENAQFPEKVAHQHRVSQYKAELTRWKLTTTHLARTAKTLLYNVLLFPEGWLLGAKDANYLRAIIIPEVSTLLYSVLHESEMQDEAMQLADVISSENHRLYECFTGEQLGNFLKKLGESALILAGQKQDFWGRQELIQTLDDLDEIEILRKIGVPVSERERKIRMSKQKDCEVESEDENSDLEEWQDALWAYMKSMVDIRVRTASNFVRTVNRFRKALQCCCSLGAAIVAAK